MRTKVFSLCAALGLLGGSGAVLAHHSVAAEYDVKQPIKIKGSVVKMEWTNPHSWIYVDVKNPDGSVTSWMIEAGAPNALLRRGWTKQNLKAGTVIAVEGFMARDGTHKANGRTVTFEDGRSLFASSPGEDKP